MTRYWTSWWSGYYTSEGCTEPPFQFWTTGQRDRRDDKNEISLIALFEAESCEPIEALIAKHFPDYEMRFCTEVEMDWRPNDRFPDFDDSAIFKVSAA